MSLYGLRIKNPSGILQLDPYGRLTRIVQKIPFTLSPGAATTIPVTGFVLDGTWAIQIDSIKASYLRLALSTGSAYISYEGLNVGTISATLVVMRF
jgi:hypothetical protein